MSEHNNRSGPKSKYWPRNGDAWEREVKDSTAVIAMIDMGQIVDNVTGECRHVDLDKTSVTQIDALSEGHSQSGHAVEVAGIIQARCNAQIHHYNVWSEAQGLVPAALESALTKIKHNSEVRILNLSIGIEKGLSDDQRIRVTELIEEIAKKIHVVAAVGESGSESAAFPASLPGVIGVQAANRYGVAMRNSNRGASVTYCGEGIQVMQDEDSYRRQDGSSYATAMMSAEIWLALHVTPEPLWWKELKEKVESDRGDKEIAERERAERERAPKPARVNRPASTIEPTNLVKTLVIELGWVRAT